MTFDTVEQPPGLLNRFTTVLGIRLDLFLYIVMACQTRFGLEKIPGLFIDVGRIGMPVQRFDSLMAIETGHIAMGGLQVFGAVDPPIGNRRCVSEPRY
jgi:hypothetical protein